MTAINGKSISMLYIDAFIKGYPHSLGRRSYSFFYLAGCLIAIFNIYLCAKFQEVYEFQPLAFG
jgi:hypothetical protein